MEYMVLNNGVKMPMAGIGTFLLTPQEAEESVCQALRTGYRLIDTANAYLNEKAVRRGIKNPAWRAVRFFWRRSSGRPSTCAQTRLKRR